MIQQLIEKNTPFSIDALIGHGSQGFVCRAVDANGRIVALKIIREGASAGEQERRRFMMEIRNHASLTHPNIVRVLESGHTNGVDWFSMDYVEGTPLSRWKGPRKGLAMFKAVAEAVAYAHEQGVIHRDLKPSNILIDASGKPQVVDFGLSKRAGNLATLTRDGHGVGTIAYADPECILGRRADERSDIYGLGMILYEWVTDGCYPYAIDRNDPRLAAFIPFNPIVPPRTRCPNVAPQIDTIIRKCLHQSPRRRYNSVRALLADIEACEQGRPVSARPAKLGQFGQVWWLRKKKMAMTVTSLSGAVVMTLAVLAGQAGERASGQARDEKPQLTEEQLWAIRADIGSKVDSLASTQLAEWSQMIYGQEERLGLPTLSSAWFNEFEGPLDEAADVINSHRFVMDVDRSKEWLLDERPIGTAAAYELTGQLIQQYLDSNGELKWLDAARNIALDAATGTLLQHKSLSCAIRRNIYTAIQKCAARGHTLGLHEWLSVDPPLVGYKGAMLREQMQVGQIIEHSAGPDGRVIVQRMSRLYGPVFPDMSDRVLPLEQEMLSLSESVFKEFQAWDEVPEDQLATRFKEAFREWASANGWELLEPMLPKLSIAFRARRDIIQQRESLLLEYCGEGGDYRETLPSEPGHGH